MSDLTVELHGVQETLLIPLAARIGEARRAGSGYADPLALQIADRLGEARFARFTQEWTNLAAVVGRTKILDREVAAFLATNPGGRVVNLACGLCTRFWRLDDGEVRWLEVDLPEVVALKRQLVPAADRYTLVAADALGTTWHDAVGPGPVLFVVEGLSMYLSEAQVRGLLAGLAARFPGSDVLIEVISPLLLRTMGRISPSIRATGARLDYGVADPRDLAALVPGTQVVGHWLHTEVHPEQWRFLRYFRMVRALHEALKVVHLRLPR